MGNRFWRTRRLALVWTAVTALAGALTTASVLTPASASASPSVRPSARASVRAPATSCASVLFVGARGSGDKGPGSKGWKPPAKGDTYGLGATVDAVYERMAADLAGKRTITVVSVRYEAYGVQTLLHAPNQYFANLATGVTWTLNMLASRAKSCPDQQIVLAGFSQGAMVVHRVLHDLGTTAPRRQILARVVNAVLAGDGDEVPNDNQIRFGTAARNARGIAQALRTISHASKVKFTTAVGARVLSVCNAHDLVCGWTDLNVLCLTVPITCPVKIAVMIAIHLSYPKSKALRAASDQAARDALTGSWHPGRLIDAAGGLTGVSCPAASYCLAVDSSGNVFTYSRGAWSGPASLGGTGQNGVSCASAGFCAIITNGATAYAGSAGRWTSSQLVGGDGNPANLTAVSCPAAGYCVALGEEDSYTYSHGAWAKGVLVQSSNTFTSISCPTTSFCEAADGGGNVYAYSRGTWSAPRQIASGEYLTAVSCRTPGFCTVTSSGTTAYTGSGASWTARQLVASDGNGANLTAVSCPATGLCVATGDWNGYLYAAGAWVRGHLIQDNNTFASVSCATFSLCAAVDSGGNAFIYTATTG